MHAVHPLENISLNMLVPGHVCSLYLATEGVNGQGLGSDEKEIILLVFTIIDAENNEVK